MKKQCTFHRLMTNYKKQEADSQNQPLKKESLLHPSEKMISPSNW
jgi:hypothetical protein